MGVWYGETGSDIGAFNPGAVEFDTGVIDDASSLSNPGPFAYGVLISSTGTYTFDLSVDVDVDTTGNFPTKLTLYDASDESTVYTDTTAHALGSLGAQTVTESWSVTVTTSVIAEIAFPGDDAVGSILTGSSLTITEPSRRKWWVGVVGWGPDAVGSG